MAFSNILLQMIVMGYKGLVAGCVVMLFSLLFKALRFPSYITISMWAVVVVRLACPFSFAASFSPFNLPYIDSRLQKAQQFGDMFVDMAIVYVEGMPQYQRAIADGVVARETDFGLKAVYLAEDGVTPAKTVRQAGMTYILSAWLIGIAGIWVYAGISYYMVYRKCRTAVLVEDNIYECDDIKSPFVLGLFKPRIYLPFGIEDKQRAYIILHERTHIRRGDHLLKPAAFLLWSLFWYNYTGWCLFRVFEEELELSCDELVIRQLGEREKEGYCQALLEYAIRFFGVSPVAFGEIGTKARIHSIMRYREPSIAKTYLTIFACVLVGIICMANPTW